RSDNPDYDDYQVDKSHILEAWEARMFISSEMP
ncbi:MAG: transcriptional regulator, partial [Bacteroidetes bacterium]